MKLNFYKLLTLSAISLCSFQINAQENTYSSPLDIPLLLSANFGELRGNHFHSGIDLKTQGVEGKKVYAIEDGYVARIGVNTGGYGLVLYINHPNGETSVYAHLQSFAPKIAKLVKERQYKSERYAIDIGGLTPQQLPVKKGEMIALSGNSGSSGGPHVHFELRETATQQVIDPLIYFSTDISDTRVPEIRGVEVIPHDSYATVYGNNIPYIQKFRTLKDGTTKTFDDSVKAWGKIAFGINAIDRMNNTNNVYGVRNIDVFCNDELISSYTMGKINFNTTRMINSAVDYNTWKQGDGFYLKSFKEPGNKLNYYKNSLPGYLDINEERIYKITYKLTDNYGNTTGYSFDVEGMYSEPVSPQDCSLAIKWDKQNLYATENMKLTFPPKVFYKDVDLNISEEDNDTFLSKIFRLNDSYVPLQSRATISFKLDYDTLANKKNYGIVEINDKNGKLSWIGGNYNNGFINSSTRELGAAMAITADTEAPKITPINPNQWVKNNKIVIKATDNLSGIASYRGTIDGKYALFEYDTKSPTYTYRIDPERITKGPHKLRFVVTDGAGNTSVYNYSFVY